MSPLEGARILVTRPAHQAQPLCDLIEAAGGHCLRQPLLTIEDPVDPTASVEQLLRAANADILVFTSRNAVSRARSLVPDWQPAGRIAAIGAATCEALVEQGLARRTEEVLVPQQDFRSESLLDLPEMQQLADQRVALITGEGGRGKLAQELSGRAAELTVVPVYSRLRCSVDEARMRALLEEADAAVVTSGEALEHLIQLVPAGMDALLRHLQLVVPSNRVLKMALEFGFEPRPLLPEKMNNESIVAVLQRWAQHGKRR